MRPVALLVGLVLFVAACDGGGDVDGSVGAAPEPADVVVVVEDAAGVQLPASAADLQVAEESGIDHTVYADFSLGAEDLDAFIAGAGLRSELREGFPPLVPTGVLDWDERLAGADDLLGINEVGDDGLGRIIMVDRAEPDRPVVYLIAGRL